MASGGGTDYPSRPADSGGDAGRPAEQLDYQAQYDDGTYHQRGGRPQDRQPWFPRTPVGQKRGAGQNPERSRDANHDVGKEMMI